MIQKLDNRSFEERWNDREGMNRAVHQAVRNALRRHMLLGESVAIGDEAAPRGVRMIGPDEIRKLLEAEGA